MRNEPAVVELLATPEGEPQPIGLSVERRCGAQAAGAARDAQRLEPVPVPAIGREVGHPHLHGVATLCGRHLGAAGDDRRELGVGRDAPDDTHRFGIGRCGHAGPDDRAVGLRVAGHHAVEERRRVGLIVHRQRVFGRRLRRAPVEEHDAGRADAQRPQQLAARHAPRRAHPSRRLVTHQRSHPHKPHPTNLIPVPHPTPDALPEWLRPSTWWHRATSCPNDSDRRNPMATIRKMPTLARRPADPPQDLHPQ